MVIMSASPFEGIFITGPDNIKEAYVYEAYEREKVEDRGKLKGKLFGVWRAPGEELKGIVSGLVESVDYGSRAVKELISIVWSD
jgi:hypothetical protein